MQRFNYDHKVPHNLSERFDKWFLHEYARSHHPALFAT